MNIFRNTFSNVLFTLTKGISGLLVIPVLIKLIGKEDYGVVLLIMSIIGYTELFDAGLKMALVRNLTAESHDEHSQSEIFVAALAGSFVYFFISAAFLSCAIFFFGVKLGLPATEVHGGYLYGFTFLFLLINILNPIFSALIISKNRLDLVNYRSATFTIIGLGLTIAMVWITGWSYRAWMLATLISKIIEFLVIFRISFIFFPNLRLDPSLFSQRKLRSLLSFGWKILIVKWNRKMKFDSDPIAISFFMGPAALALYRPGVALVQSIRPLVTSLSAQLYVTASTAEKNKDRKTMRKIFLTGSKLTFLVFLPVFFVLFYSGEFLIDLWLGNSFSSSEIKQIYQVMLGWLFIDLFFYLEGSSYSVLFGINKLDFMIKTDFLISIANITFSVLLLKYSDFGILSVLIPGLMIELFARVGFFMYTARQIDISMKSCLKDYLIPLLMVFGMIFIPLSLVQAQQIAFMAGILILFLLTGLIYPFLAWKLGLSPEERILISQNLQKYLPFLKRILR